MHCCTASWPGCVTTSSATRRIQRRPAGGAAAGRSASGIGWWWRKWRCAGSVTTRNWRCERQWGSGRPRSSIRQPPSFRCWRRSTKPPGSPAALSCRAPATNCGRSTSIRCWPGSRPPIASWAVASAPCAARTVFAALALELVGWLRRPPPAGHLRNAVEHMGGYVDTQAERAIAEVNTHTAVRRIGRLAQAQNIAYLLAQTALTDLAAWPAPRSE